MQMLAFLAPAVNIKHAAGRQDVSMAHLCTLKFLTTAQINAMMVTKEILELVGAQLALRDGLEILKHCQHSRTMLRLIVLLALLVLLPPVMQQQLAFHVYLDNLDQPLNLHIASFALLVSFRPHHAHLLARAVQLGTFQK